MSRTVTLIDLAEARGVLEAAIARSREIDVPVFVVVVNALGQTVAAARVDGANFFAERIAIGKALTAVGMGVSTDTWEHLSESAPAFAGGITSVKDFTPFAGGVPLMVGGQLIGAVGISGGTSEQDIDIADAAAAVIE